MKKKIKELANQLFVLFLKGVVFCLNWIVHKANQKIKKESVKSKRSKFRIIEGGKVSGEDESYNVLKFPTKDI